MCTTRLSRSIRIILINSISRPIFIIDSECVSSKVGNKIFMCNFDEMFNWSTLYYYYLYHIQTKHPLLPCCVFNCYRAWTKHWRPSTQRDSSWKTTQPILRDHRYFSSAPTQIYITTCVLYIWSVASRGVNYKITNEDNVLFTSINSSAPSLFSTFPR